MKIRREVIAGQELLRFKIESGKGLNKEIAEIKEVFKEMGITGYKELTEEDRKIGEAIAKEMGGKVVNE